MTNNVVDMAGRLWDEGRWDELIPLVQARFQEARDARDLEGEADALGEMTFLYGAVQRPEDATRAARFELRVRRRLGEPLGIARALGSLASALEDQGLRPAALAHARKALQAYLVLDPALDARLEIAPLGQLFLDSGRYREARKAFREALVQRSPGTRCVLRSVSLRSLAKAHEALGDLPEAIRCLHEAVSERHRVRLDCSEALRQLAELHLKAGQPWQAAELLKEAAESARAHGNADGAEVARQRLRSLESARGTGRLLERKSPFKPY